MATVFKNRTFTLTPDLLPTELYNQYQHLTYGIFSNLYVPNSNATVRAATYTALKQSIQKAQAPFDVYLREKTPPQFHIGHFNKQRYGDIIIIARISSFLKKTSGTPVQVGNHGYDNNNTLMRGIFLAHGPAFKKGYVSEPFENIQLYDLMCSLLHIPPSPNNGTAGALNDILAGNTTP